MVEIGSIVRVQTNPDQQTATWYRTADADQFRNKINRHLLFNRLTINVPRLLPLVFRGDTSSNDKITMDLAPGIRLSDNDIHAFISLGPADYRFGNLLTYLETLRTLHSNSYAFKDHKLDGVFCFSNRPGRIPEGICIPDTDKMIKVDSPKTAWHIDSKKENGLHTILQSFFTGSLGNDNELVPQSVHTVIQKPLHSFPSVKKLLDELYGLWTHSQHLDTEFDFVEKMAQQRLLAISQWQSHR